MAVNGPYCVVFSRYPWGCIRLMGQHIRDVSLAIWMTVLSLKAAGTITENRVSDN